MKQWFGSDLLSVGIEIRNADKVMAKLAHWQKGEILDKAITLFTNYLIEQLKQYPPYKHVSRAAAYGQTFVSDRQRRWFFAALKSGELDLPYGRTGTLANSWRSDGLGSDHVKIFNEAPYAGYVIEQGTQARMMQMIGWKTTQELITVHRRKFAQFFHKAAEPYL